MLLCFHLVAAGQNESALRPVKTTYDLLNRVRDTLKMDTLTSGSQIYHPLYSLFPCWQELGNLGFPAFATKWNGISKLNEPFFVASIRAYTNPAGKLIQYQSNKPYALLNYTSGGTKDINGQFIRAVFARPVTPSFRFTALLDFINSPGFYANQAANQSSFTLNVEVRKPRYRLDAGIEKLQFKLGENGGLSNPTLLQSTKIPNRGSLSVNLGNAGSNTSLSLIQGRQEWDAFASPFSPVRDSTDSISYVDTLRSKPLPKLFHSFNYELSGRLYKDEQNAQKGFYQDFYNNPNLAQDSMSFKFFDNRIGVLQSGMLWDSLQWQADIGVYDHLAFYGSNELSGNFQQFGAFANGQLSHSNWLLNLQARIQLLGYGMGTYFLQMDWTKSQLFGRFDARVDLESRIDQPSIFFQAFSGNHDRWFQSLRNQQEQNASLTLVDNVWKLDAGFHASLISNWVYFDSLARPAQTDFSSFVAAAFVTKRFQAGPFRSVNYLRVQYTPAKEIPLPVLVASTSTFMHHDILFPKTNGKLELEYGFDVRYCSEYQGYAYRPSTGAFYLQNQQSMGNYPYADLFLTLRVKRTRVFVKWEHVNAGLTGYNFMPVLNYPVKERFLKYGVYWHFYD